MSEPDERRAAVDLNAYRAERNRFERVGILLDIISDTVMLARSRRHDPHRASRASWLERLWAVTIRHEETTTPRGRILASLEDLGDDETTVLALVAERLAMGRRLYGELHPATDPRDFAREALEEAADGLVYVAAALVRSGKPWGAVPEDRRGKGGV